MKSRGMLKAVLSGVAVLGLMLGLFAVQEAGAATDVYLVRPFSTSNSGTANAVWQTFVATCDSIDSVTYFVGAEATDTTANYLVSITDSATSQEVWSSSRSARGWKYQDMGFGVHKPVVRGKTYYLRMSISAQYQQTWNYFYDNYNPYPWGRMGTASYGLNDKDLAARVIGRGKVLDVWGLNSHLSNRDYPLDSTQIRRMVSNCKAEGVTIIREPVRWRDMEPDSTHQELFNWGRTDSILKAAKDSGLTVLWTFWGCAPWATSKPPADTDSPEIHPPWGLYNQVFDGSGNPNKNNPFGYYVYQVVNRYGHKHLNTNWNPVDYWEIWNEENAAAEWDYPDPQKYPGVTTSDRLVALYDTLVHAAFQAIKDPSHGADYPDSAKIVMGGLHRTLASCTTCVVHPTYAGVSWLDRFLQYGGGQWVDIYAFHPYQQLRIPPDSTKFRPGTFQKDVDTLRHVLKNPNYGQGSKPLWANEVGWAACTSWNVDPLKQADYYVQFHSAAIEQGANPKGPLDKLMWYQLLSRWGYNDPQSDTSALAWGFCGMVNCNYPYDLNPMHYAAKQMNIKLKDKYFNRRVPRPDSHVYDYEFQNPGPDTALRTWCLWRDSGQAPMYETLSIRTNVAYLVTRDTGGVVAPDSIPIDTLPGGSGKIRISPSRMDTVPRYLHEVGVVSRPDVVVESVWLVKASGTGEPRAGEGIRFYARIRNIGNAALDSTIADTVSFYVDGERKAKHGARRGLGTPGSGTDTLTVGYIGVGPAPDWTATGGDHLIRAWADSSDRYVELREDNNQGYIFKHIQPKVSLIINNNSKYSNHLSNNSVAVTINGNTSPNPDSTYYRHESGNWTKIGHTTSFDTLVTYSGNGVMFDSVLIFQGADRDTSWDSIIVDVNAPYKGITSPPDGQQVGPGQPVEFWGFSYDYEDHDSLWEIWESAFAWADSNNKVGNPWFGPGYFGTWSSSNLGLHTHTLVTRDSATNFDTVSVRVYVVDIGGDGGDGFASGFGSFGSSPVNVATDPKGNVYIPETQGSMVRKYSPKKDTLFSFSARRGQDSTGFAWPAAIACDPDTSSGRLTLYVADGYAHCIKRFDGQGNLLLRFGTFGSDSAGKFKQPSGIALDHKGRLFIVDRGNHRIQVYDTTGAFLFGFGGLGRDSGKMNSPTGIAITRGPETSSGRRFGLVYVTDTKNQQVQVFDSLGRWVKTIKKPDSLGFDTPTGICVDRHGDIFIADTKHNRIVELNPYGRRLFTFGEQGDSLWQFRNPIGVTTSPGGHYLYVADMGNKRVTRFWVIRGDTLGGGGPQAGAVVQVLPLVYELGPAIPNPSKGQTTFRYALPKESLVNFTIYNVAGQVVRELKQGKQKAGYYSITWDGRSNLGHRVGAGVYFYRLTAGNWVKTRKMVVIR